MLLAETYPTESKFYHVISITSLAVDQVSFGVTNDVTYICPPCSYRWICPGQICWWRLQSPQPVQPGLSHCPSYWWQLLLDEVPESHHRTGKVNTKSFAYKFNEESTVCELCILSFCQNYLKCTLNFFLNSFSSFSNFFCFFGSSCTLVALDFIGGRLQNIIIIKTEQIKYANIHFKSLIMYIASYCFITLMAKHYLPARWWSGREWINIIVYVLGNICDVKTFEDTRQSWFHSYFESAI